MKKKVTLILVNYKTIDCVIECIESIKEQTYDNIEIIVVDNNSKDNCVDIINEKWSDVITIQNKENLGFSEANNIGINLAISRDADYIMLLNCDTILTKEYVLQLYEVAECNTNVGIISGKILYYYSTDLIWSAGGSLNAFKGSADIIDFNKKNYFPECKITECSFASGCCMLIPKRIFSEVGLLSNRYFLYFEDTDFCAKIVKSGAKIFINNNAIMYHKESVSTGKRSNLYTYYNIRNRFIYIKHNIDKRHKPISYIYSLLWILKNTIYGSFGFKALIWALIDFCRGIEGKSKRQFV